MVCKLLSTVCVNQQLSDSELLEPTPMSEKSWGSILYVETRYGVLALSLCCHFLSMISVDS